MHRVREQREAAGEEAADDLDHRVGGREPERERERAAALAAAAVVVVVSPRRGFYRLDVRSGRGPGIIGACARSSSRSSPSSRSPPRSSSWPSARTTANGLPAYTNGWQKWPKINRKPFTSTGPLSSAHTGVKNVYASKRKVGSKYPNGTVIVKTIVKPGTRYVGQFAVMRKVRTAAGASSSTSARAPAARYTRARAGTALHVVPRAWRSANDYVFTKR